MSIDGWVDKENVIYMYIYQVCAQSYLTLCNPMDCSPQALLQVRILEWIAISSSRASSWPRDWTCISCVSCIGRQVDSLPLNNLGSPVCMYVCMCVCVCVCVYGLWYYSTFEKKKILLFQIHVDESGRYYAKWNKPDKDTYHVVSFIYGIK